MGVNGAERAAIDAAELARVDADELGRLDAAAALAARDDASAVREALAALHWLLPSIEADAASGRFGSWGDSTVIDEHTRAPLISRALFDALHEAARLDADWPTGNAGLLHTYGYLLSLASTPYGLKRERWLRGELARAFGLAADAFVPWRAGPTLLARATSAADSVLGRPAASLAHRILHVDGRELHIVITRAAGADAAALVFGIDDGSGVRLITTFPVSEPGAVLAEIDAEPPRLRWNAA